MQLFASIISQQKGPGSHFHLVIYPTRPPVLIAAEVLLSKTQCPNQLQACRVKADPTSTGVNILLHSLVLQVIYSLIWDCEYHLTNYDSDKNIYIYCSYFCKLKWNQNHNLATNATQSSVKPTCLWLAPTHEVRPLTSLWILVMTVDIWCADSSSGSSTSAGCSPQAIYGALLFAPCCY